MKHQIKKVIAAHDLSGLGRCSLSAVMPILSVMGIQAVALPTAILSTQTDGYENFTFHDMTDGIEDYFNHLISHTDAFDAFYSGFLGSAGQIDKICHMTERVKDKMTVLVDPVMGDGGEYYSTYNEEMSEGMRRLIKNAHIIVPNITEASFLLSEEPKEKYSDEDVKSYVKRLSHMTGGSVVITGIKGKGSVSSAFSSDGGITVGFQENHSLDCHYPGTGDIFASVMLGALLNGKNLSSAVKQSAEFVKEVMEYSAGFDYPKREGVLLEAKLSKLMNF